MNYTKKQVLEKSQMAERFLYDSKILLNPEMEMSELCGALNCLAAAHNMLREIYYTLKKNLNLKMTFFKWSLI